MLTDRSTYLALAAAIALALAFWIDPLYLPLILLGPPISGLVVGLRGGGWRPLAIAWGVAGILALVSDWILNREDVAFHAVVTVVMVATSTVGWTIGRAAHRRRRSGRDAVAAPT